MLLRWFVVRVGVYVFHFARISRCCFWNIGFSWALGVKDGELEMQMAHESRAGCFGTSFVRRRSLGSVHVCGRSVVSCISF